MSRAGIATALVVALSCAFAAGAHAAAVDVVPSLVKDINPGAELIPPFPDSSEPHSFAQVGSAVFFIADDGVHGRELWKTDGTAAGTALVKDVNPGDDESPGTPDSGNIGTLTPVGGTLYFDAEDGTNGLELWKSDGTAAGTEMVEDINPTGNSSPGPPFSFEGALYFSANDGVNGRELWKSTDGTAPNTDMLDDFNPTGDFSPGEIAEVNGAIVFGADDGVNGNELWRSDGTAEGTQLVQNINAGSSSFPARYTELGGQLLFTANDGPDGVELWKTDGIPGGTTQMVEDIATAGADSNPAALTRYNGMVVFEATAGGTGREMWKSDGTAAGTDIVKDINPGLGDSFPQPFVEVDGVLLMAPNDGTSGAELWRSDGTAAGTSLVKDINPDGGSGIIRMTEVNGTGLFRATAGASTDLWKTDGTAANTAAVAVNPSGPSQPEEFFDFGGTALFQADDGVHGVELMKATITPVPPPSGTNPTPVIKKTLCKKGSKLKKGKCVKKKRKKRRKH